jgi:V8-like Glu-specific endopeptidase
MMITLGRRVAASAGAVIAVGMLAFAIQASVGAVDSPAAGGFVKAAAGAPAPAAAVRYWTHARVAAALRSAYGRSAAMPPPSRARRLIRRVPTAPPAAAQPWLTGDTAGHGLGWTHGGAVAAAVGKVFFTLGGEDYVCSGTLVGTGHVDLVLTAAHCVTGGSGRARATNWIFVPGFRDGLMPYGEYTARRFFFTSDWTGPESGSEQYDVAFVQVTAATQYGTAGAAKPPPGLPVEFADSQDADRQDLGPLSRTYVFGYPAEPPFSGLDLSYCAGPSVASDGSVRTPCEMTAGDSGGPWLAGFGPQSGSGQVVAVSTYKVSGNLGVLYGAVLGPQARALYERAVSSIR